MTWKTHIIGGAQAGILLAQAHNGNMTESAVLIGTAMLGSALPDIDHEKSKLAQGDAIVGLASSAICRLTKHRGFTHTVPGALTFALLAYALMMFNSAQQALIALIGAFSGFIVLQLFGALRKYSVILALAAYMAAPRVLPYIQGKAMPIEFSPETAKLAAIGVFAGCIMHLLYDLFNKRGIALLWPIYRKPLHLLSIKTRSTGEGFFAAVMLTALAFTITRFYSDVHVVDLIRRFFDEITAMVAGA